MKLTIRPHHSNIYPKSGVLIKSKSVQYWLEEINRMGLELAQTKVFPIPDVQPNSVWGCLLLVNKSDQFLDSIHPICQLVDDKLFIPANSRLYPNLTPEEMNRLAGEKRSVYHPAFGLVSLEDELNWQSVLSFEQPGESVFRRPVEGKEIPTGNIQSFKVQTLNPDEVMKEMEENSFPKKESLASKPLSIGEKLKFWLLKMLFKDKSKGKGDKSPTSSQDGESSGSFLSRLLSGSKVMKKLQTDFEELQTECF